MRFIPGAAAGLVFALGIIWARYGGHHDPKPPDSFLDSELTLGDEGNTGSCYSVRVVLQNHLMTLPSAVAAWQSSKAQEWSMRMEWIEQPGSMPQSQWATISLRQHDKIVDVLSISTSAHGVEPIEPFVKDLVSVPRERKVPPAARCRTKS